MRVHDKTIPMVEINFLCVHKKLRSKRLAPVLIKEITRRTNVQGIFQAVCEFTVIHSFTHSFIHSFILSAGRLDDSNANPPSYSSRIESSTIHVVVALRPLLRAFPTPQSISWTDQ